MITNDLKEELNKLGIEVRLTKEGELEFFKNGEAVTLKMSTIRRIFLNSLVSHIDNIIDK